MPRRRFHIAYAPTYEAAHKLKSEYALKAKEEEKLDAEYQVRRRANNFEIVVRLDNQQAKTVQNSRQESADGYTKKRSKRKRATV